MRWARLNDRIKTKTGYSLIVALGFILSVVVYFSVKEVEKSTKILVERQIPILSTIQQVMATISEQERTLYEYYSTIDELMYQHSYIEARQDAHRKIDTLARYFPENKNIVTLYKGIVFIDKRAKALHQNISSPDTSWDLARLQLTQISQQRRDIIALLQVLEKKTRQDVASAYNNTLKQLDKTNYTVLIYSLSIIIIAFAVGQSMRVYFRVSIKNKRLALFTERNPHPILSVTEHREIIYYNPATIKLIESQRKNGLKIDDLIPDDFLACCVTAKGQERITQVEHHLYDMTLRCEIHWLPDLNVFDLHISDITAEKLAENQLKFQAFHYPQSTLYNSYKLNELLDLQIAQQQSFSLGQLEISHYNRFVAGHGIGATQELVKGAALRLHYIVSESEQTVELFQLNEKTFAFIVHQVCEEARLVEFYLMIEHQMEAVLSTPYGEFSIELDCGFCSFPDHADNRDTLLQHARIALDEAIGSEHLRFSYFNHQLSLQMNNTMMLTGWLRQAIRDNELYLVYQPQMNIDSGHVIGMETLLRWQHDGRSISPADFVPIAEQTGLIIEIGQWVLQQACSATKALIDQGYSDLVIAVNISPRQFSHPSFLNMVQQVLHDTQLKPQNLELEITEGVMLYNEHETISLLHQLKALGLMLSIDDFGTGYSSLSYLKQFPVNKLKIDQSFVKNLHTDTEDKAIVQAIIDLGKNLGLKIIAEGVEHSSHFDFLKSLHCDEIQGYWFSKPLDLPRFTRFLAEKLLQ